MEKDRCRKGREQDRIDGIGITEDVLTGRGGLAVFVRYLRGIEINPHLERLFGSMRGSRKGQPVSELFKQLICYFVDGTSRHVRLPRVLLWIQAGTQHARRVGCVIGRDHGEEGELGA